jgi:hypothetical protein
MSLRTWLLNRAFVPSWGSLWTGVGSLRRGLVQLAGGVLRILLCGWIWSTAVRLAHFHPPIKVAGAVLALVGIVVFIWALKGLWRGFRTLGIKRFVALLGIAFSVVVALNVLTIPDNRPVPQRILTQIVSTGQRAWRVVTDIVQSIVDAPDAFLFAYTGERSAPSPPPGFPTPNPQATPIQAVGRSADGGSVPSPGLRVGGYVRVIGTGGQSLRARAGPGVSFEVVARLPEGSRLFVLDGPIMSSEFTWWKVRYEDGEGWCADRWLTASD